MDNLETNLMEDIPYFQGEDFLKIFSPSLSSPMRLYFNKCSSNYYEPACHDSDIARPITGKEEIDNLTPPRLFPEDRKTLDMNILY